jgi:hypothetical protein
MRTLRMFGSVIAFIFFAQQAPATVEQAPAATPMPTASPSAPFIVPAGTHISMTLSTQLTAKETRAGTPVRAITSFPVSSGSQVVIPVGTFVEGSVVSVKKRTSNGPQVRIHFTNLLYANGYSVPLDGSNLLADVVEPEVEPESESSDVVASQPDRDAPLYAFNLAAAPAQQQPSPLPPLHNPGPNVGVIAGASLGVTAAVIAVTLIAHRGGYYSPILFDTGWQFEMVLQSPLALDASSVAAAMAAAPAAQ